MNVNKTLNSLHNVHSIHYIIKFTDDAVTLSLLHKDVDCSVHHVERHHTSNHLTKTQDLRHVADYKATLIFLQQTEAEALFSQVTEAVRSEQADHTTRQS